MRSQGTLTDAVYGSSGPTADAKPAGEPKYPEPESKWHSEFTGHPEFEYVFFQDRSSDEDWQRSGRLRRNNQKMK